jgi:ElaA protein
LTPLAWTWARFEALSGREVHDLLALRSEVFVVEQNCVFQDVDGADLVSWHLLGRTVQGELAVYLRVVDAGVKFPEISIGRVVSSPRARGAGIGRVLMQEGLKRCLATHGPMPIRIGAQARLASFYQSLGFITVAEPYIEDGIPHLEMLRTL